TTMRPISKPSTWRHSRPRCSHVSTFPILTRRRAHDEARNRPQNHRQDFRDMTLTDDTDPRPESTNGADTPKGSEGWLGALRNRLGLGTQPTLRDTLGETLRVEDQTGTGFSPAEREMLLRLLEF